MKEEHFIKIDTRSFDLRPLYEELDPIGDVRIDQSDLTNEFMRQAGLVAAYGYLSAEAEKEEKLIEYQLDRLYAKLDHDVRREFVAAGEKATETKIRNSVITQKEYQETKLELIEAHKNTKLFKATCTALSHKLQALINAGADHRKSSNEPTILREK
tara:strand:- start:690 stop:1160 length:471 start_codon:yes stop_codon:yes gene_type:complete